MPVVSVVVPTIRVREEAGWLDRCLDAYERNTSRTWEPIVVRDKSTCGIAWNEGIAQAKGEFIHLTADDIEPLAGWDSAGIRVIRQGHLPAARILNSDGTLQSCGTDHLEHDTGEEAFVARIPFGSRAQFERIGPMFERHYMGDYWFSHRGRQVGLKTIVERDFCFVHHFAMEGRIDGLREDVRHYKSMGGE
jgi:hypothetical protein